MHITHDNLKSYSYTLTDKYTSNFTKYGKSFNSAMFKFVLTKKKIDNNTNK